MGAERVLREIDLFRDLDEAEMDRVGNAAHMADIPAGQRLYSPEQPNELLFIIKRGRIRLFQVSPDGRTLTTAILEAGQVFGEMHALGQRLDQTYAEALDPCMVCIMSRTDVERLLLSDKRIATRIAEYLGARVVDLERKLGDTVLRHTPERIAALLARLALPAGGNVRLTHEQLADLVGTSRETVTKVLGDLVQRGLITQRRGRISVHDPARLASLADSGFTVTTGG